MRLFRLFAYAAAFAIFCLKPLALIAGYSLDMLISWRWSTDPAPLVARMTSVRRKRETVKHMTRTSPRSFASTGFYAAASPA